MLHKLQNVYKKQNSLNAKLKASVVWTVCVLGLNVFETDVDVYMM